MKSFFLTLFAAALTFSISAQTADEIVAKHIEAIGGKDVLSKMNSLYLESTMSVMGNDAPSRTCILNGKGFKNELDIMGSTIIQCVTDKGAWGVNPMAGGGVVDVPEKQAKGSIASTYIGGAFFNYAEKGFSIELDGKKKVGEVEAFKLKVTPKGGNSIAYYIDPTTYYILKMETRGEVMGQEVEITTTYSDYKKLENGYVHPHTMDIDMGQFAMTAKVEKVEINKAMDEATFSKPK